MEIENTSLWREVLKVANSNENNTHYALAAVIHLMASKQDYRAFKVIEFDIERDYVNNYTDKIFIKVTMPIGDYAYQVYPNRSNLELSVVMSPRSEIGGDNNASAQRVERFAATLVDTGNPMVDITASNAPGQEAMNRRGFIDVQMQLVDKAAAMLRFAMLGGIWRKATVEDVLKTVMVNESRRILVDDKIALQGVDMVPAHNTQVRDHIVIPQGIRLVDVPNYIQEKVGGIYSSGLGYYLYQGYWYIYPAYDVKRYNQTTRAVTIVNIPENKMPGIERTYRKNGDNVVILATGKIKFNDPRKSNEQNFGNGARFSNANMFMGEFFTTEDNKSVTQQVDITNEFVVDQQATEKTFAPIAPERITTNSYKQLSRLAQRRGAIFNLVWENSDPTLILPGTLANILYLSNGVVSSAIGVILKAHHFTAMEGQGFTDSRYVRRSILTFFVESPVS